MNLQQPRFIPRGLTPTYEQRLIQLAQQRISLVEAGAGTAKTTTLALRVGEALQRGVRPEQILVWVFTEPAATVFRHRLQELGVAPAVLGRMNIGTVETFARAQWARWGEAQTPYIEQLGELQEPILQALEDCSERYRQWYPYLEIRTHAAAVSQFFSTLLRLKHSLAWEDEDLSLSAEERAELVQVPLVDYLWAKSYEQNRLGAFGDALFRGPFDASYDLACALNQQPELSAGLPDYRLIVIDELHDMNATAFRILRALLQSGTTYLVAAGDSDQVIYPHMGADRRYLHEHFQAHFRTVQRYQLSHSFRFGPWLALTAGAFKNKPLQSGRARPTALKVQQYGQPTQLPEQLLQTVSQLIQRPGRNLSQCAVILRALHQSVLVENALLLASVPYQCHGFSPYLLRDEILFVRGLLALALDEVGVLHDTTRRAVVEALSLFGEAQLSVEDLALAQEDIVQDASILHYFHAIRLVAKASDTARHRNQMALKILQRHGPQAPAAPALTELCAAIDLAALAKRLYVDTDQAQIITQSIEGLIALAQSEGHSLHSLYRWMAEADAFVDAKLVHRPQGSNAQAAQHRLQLLCADEAKGKEFPFVLLPFLAQGEFPRPGVHSLTEENLFYVACTRAQDELHLFVPRAIEQQSVFVSRMQVPELRGLAQEQIEHLQATQPATTKDRVTASPTALRVTGAATAWAGGGRPYAAGAAGTAGRAGSPATGFQRPPAQQVAQQSGQPGAGAGQRERIYLQVPFAEKDEAKALGAYWDPEQRSWYIPPWADSAPLLQRWPRRPA